MQVTAHKLSLTTFGYFSENTCLITDSNIPHEVNSSYQFFEQNVGISFQATAESELQGIQGKALAISMEVRCAPKVAVFAVSEGKPFWYALFL